MTTALSSPRDEIELQNSDPVPPADSQCNVCQKPAAFMCSSCGLNGPRYCSTECQSKGWREGHYRLCQGNAQARATAASRASNHTPPEPAAEPASGQGSIPMVELGNNGNSTEQDEQREFADDLRFYIKQIYLVIQPVVICIILSIFWVKVAFSGSSDYTPVRPSYSIGSSTTTTSGGSNNSSSSSAITSLTTALVIVGQIIVVTLVIVFLFRRGWIKILVGFFMIVVVGLLGFMSYLLILNLIQVFYIPLDYPTMVFALWNFAVVGLISVFWKSPLWMQQAYLTIMSSLMAFSLTGLEEWTTWMLLGLLAIWDLIAVLCPFGPLRLLIESSRNQQREVPALLYSVNAVWFMASMENHFRISKSFLPKEDHEIGTNWIYQDSGQSVPDEGTSQTATTVEPVRSESPQPLDHNELDQNWTSGTGPQGAVIEGQVRDGFTRLRGESVNTFATGHEPNVNTPSPAVEPTSNRNSQASNSARDPDTVPADEEDAERSGLKLGLGDFVFYSVLIARAAIYDWITTVCCTVAVLMGLTATIFLLVLWKKALPALPISIAFGVMFYFVAKAVLVPYVGAVSVFGMVAL